MQLRTFTAPTLTEAMASVRAELGPDAFVLATDQPEHGPARVVAALAEPAAAPVPDESDMSDDDATTTVSARVPREPIHTPTRPAPTSLAQVFARHAVPSQLVDQLLRGSPSGGPLTLRLQAALGANFNFSPLVVEQIDQPLLLAGPAGGGKTVTAAKLALEARLAGRDVHLVTLDTWRAAGAEQLSRYAAKIGISCDAAYDCDALAEILAELPSETLAIIDTPALNAFDGQDCAELVAWGEASRTSPLLVLPAGLDAGESAELAHAYATLGATRLIATRIDSSRRLGNLLAAAHAAAYSFAAAGLSAHVANGLIALDADILARCLIQDDRNADALSDHDPDGTAS